MVICTETVARGHADAANAAERIDDHEIADKRIVFVRWSDAANKRGRECHTDAQDRIVYSLGHGKEHPERSWAKDDIVVNCIGAHMIGGAKNRSRVPQDILRLQHHFDASLRASSELRAHRFAKEHDICNLSLDLCEYCGTSEGTYFHLC